ncbi:MAG: DUF4476 domain-containing protein [Ignavibacteriota bacterium]
MKKTLYIFALLLMLTSAANTFAQKVTSLTISLYDGSTFGVEFDKSVIAKQIEEVTIDGIAAGKHYIKITPTNATKPIYSSEITITEGYTIRAVIDEYKSFYVYQKYKYRKTKGGIEITDWEHHNGNRDHDEENYRVISDPDFIDLENIAAGTPFDETRTELLKYGIDRSYFTTDQVNSLIKMLTFETYKVEIAKYAYKKTVDKRNYLRVFGNFRYSSSITELKDYIDSFK